jgi:uncharacterized transporter YbjL
MPPDKGTDKDVVLISIFMALEGLFAYSAFLPSIMTTGVFVDSPQKVTMIRQGELVGTFFLVILAVVTAYITKSKWPVIFGIAAGLIALAIYEYSLRQSPAFQGKMNLS